MGLDRMGGYGMIVVMRKESGRVGEWEMVNVISGVCRF